MATLDQLQQAIGKADKAGDAIAVQRLTQIYKTQFDNERMQEQKTESAGQQPTGRLDAILRAGAAGASFNSADEIAAAADAMMPLSNLASKGPTFGNRYEQNLVKQRAVDRANAQAYPVTSFLGNIGGAALTLGAGGAKIPQTMGQAAALGGGTGAVAGFGAGEGGFGNRAKSAVISGGIGAALGITAHKLAKMLQGGSRAPSTRFGPQGRGQAALERLKEAGVNPTAAQEAGGALQRLEEGLISVPGLGDEVIEAHAGVLDQFNRAAYNEALKPLGIKYPQASPIGHEGIDIIKGGIGRSLDRAQRAVSVNLDDALQTDISGIYEKIANRVPSSARAQFRTFINNDVIGAFENRILSGDKYKTVDSVLREMVEDAGQGNAYDRLLGRAFNEVRQALRNSAIRATPEAATDLRAAETAYANFVRVQTAAGASGSSEGVFTPAQLAQAIRATDKSLRKSSYASGKALLQTLANDGKEVLGKTLADSGTPYRLRSANMLNLLGSVVTEIPGQVAYSKTGQAVAKNIGPPIAGALRRSIGIVPVPIGKRAGERVYESQ